MTDTTFPLRYYERLDLHVAEPPRAVIRAAWRTLGRDAKRRASRDARRTYLMDMLEHHAQARELYRYVVTGRLPEARA